jgi:hypothetical protein
MEPAMFGRPVSEYLNFQKLVLALLAVMGLARLGLSLAGLPNSTVRWLSMNAVAWAGIVYYGVAAHARGFGYKQLLPLALFQTLVFQAVAVLGIALAIVGRPNIYSAPEYSFGAHSQAFHLMMHLTVGVVVATLLAWGVACLVLLITKKLSPRPASAGAAAR